jgi:hypothetical protein
MRINVEGKDCLGMGLKSMGKEEKLSFAKHKDFNLIIELCLCCCHVRE